MTKEEAIKKTRTLFMVQAACIVTIVALFETGTIARNTIALAPTAKYIADVAGVMLTIALIPLALKGFSALIEREVKRKNPHFIEFFYTKSTARISILFVTVMMNLALYYCTGNNSALYCGILAGGAYIYSFPTMATLNSCLEQIREREER